VTGLVVGALPTLKQAAGGMAEHMLPDTLSRYSRLPPSPACNPRGGIGEHTPPDILSCMPPSPASHPRGGHGEAWVSTRYPTSSPVCRPPASHPRGGHEGHGGGRNRGEPASPCLPASPCIAQVHYTGLLYFYSKGGAREVHPTATALPAHLTYRWCIPVAAHAALSVSVASAS
jgi:hypothetical protein